MYKDKNLIKFATFREQTPTTYCLIKAITPKTNREDFKNYCDYYGLDMDSEKERREELYGKRFNW